MQSLIIFNWLLPMSQLKMSTKRGMIIVLEGLDRVGKSTQAAKLVQLLKEQGRPAELIRFPDRSTLTGEIISKHLSGNVPLNNHAVHLLFTANRWEKYDKMLELVRAGVTLVIDRYSYSGVAYSSAKGLDFQWCRGPEKGLPKPDCLLFLANNVDEIQKRDNFGDEIFENADFQKAVQESYRKMIEPDWNIIETRDKNIDQVHAEIMTKVRARFENLSEEINFLW